MRREANLWAMLRSKLQHAADRLDRIENLTTDGMPDVQGCFDGMEVWMELKVSQLPAKSTTPVLSRAGNHKLLDTQIVWFARQRRAGGIAFIVVLVARELYLINGVLYADVINSWTLQDFRDNAVAWYKCPMTQEQWELMRNVIIIKTRHHQHHHQQQSVNRDATVERKRLARAANARRKRR